MSMTFDVYPAVATFPSFARLLAAATEQLHLRLLRLGIDRHPQVALRIEGYRWRRAMKSYRGQRSFPLLPNPKTIGLGKSVVTKGCE